MLKSFGKSFWVWIALFGVGILTACTDQSEKLTPVDHHTSQIAVDWTGHYVGHLPCADCEAIHWQLSLYDDYSFNLIRDYVGRSTGVFNDEGSFSWAEDGQRILLITQTGEKLGFFVGENRIWLLDQDHRRIEGALADVYQLIKQP